jgi:hypothetical protein
MLPAKRGTRWTWLCAKADAACQEAAPWLNCWPSAATFATLPGRPGSPSCRFSAGPIPITGGTDDGPHVTRDQLPGPLAKPGWRSTRHSRPVAAGCRAVRRWRYCLTRRGPVGSGGRGPRLHPAEGSFRTSREVFRRLIEQSSGPPLPAGRNYLRFLKTDWRACIAERSGVIRGAKLISTRDDGLRRHACP